MTDTNARLIRSPRGPQITCKSWYTEAAMRMLMNNLDPDVAERPQDLVVYGGIGKAARNWDAFDRIVETLKNSNPMKRSSSSPASRSACSKHTKQHRAC